MSPGDIVVIKSGGPKMVVYADMGNGTVKCMWFTQADQCLLADFPTTVLTKVITRKRG